MKMRVQDLIIFRITDSRGKLLHDMLGLMAGINGAADKKAADEAQEMPVPQTAQAEDKARALLYSCIHELLEMADEYGFSGNLWHCYLTCLLVNHENSYSRGCEKRGGITGTVNRAVLHDMELFREWFDYDFDIIKKTLHTDDPELVLCYESGMPGGRVYHESIRAAICALAATLGQGGPAARMQEKLTDFYREYGVGELGLHKAFRIQAAAAGMPSVSGGGTAAVGGVAAMGEGAAAGTGTGIRIVPIANIAPVRMADLVGYEIAKQKLTANTEAFVAGKSANNCLLYGDAGTGKSSSIKALANEYYSRGLRMIEIYKHQSHCLPEVTALLKMRNYKFILYMDDLSFEDFEVEYKYLKAVIEGGLEQRPANVLIYATSNRRHLIREKFSDKEDGRDDLHKGDTVQEKLSLAARFGVTVYFGAPDRREFQNIVAVLADRDEVKLPREELLAEANRWEMIHGGLSGRTARQFVDYLTGRD